MSEPELCLECQQNVPCAEHRDPPCRACESRIYPTYRDMQADLVGTFEIAANLGIDKNTVRRWIQRRESTGCPAPIVELGGGCVYSLAEWKGWYAVWRVTRGQESWWMNKGSTC